MVGSMVFQFLPILAQRAHRKQEKLNKLGPQMRDALLPLLHSVSAHLDLIEEAKPVKPLLEEFIEGKDVTRLGDFVAALFKGISTCKDKQKVSEAITGVAPDLLTSLPQLFPDLFGATAPEGEAGPPEHRGISCSACNREPIKGPRFHSAEACIDLCGECFLGQGCEVTDQQFQCFFVPQGTQSTSQENSTGSWREHAKPWRDCHDWKDEWRRAWREKKDEWKKELWQKKGEFCKGKGKGKSKGKGKGKWSWCHSAAGADASEVNSTAGDSMASVPTVDASDVTNDYAPPGLDLPQQPWETPWWNWKGHGKGKDWSSWCPWAVGGGPLMPPLPPPFWQWGWDAWPSDGQWGQFENTSFDGMSVPTSSAERKEEDINNKASNEKIEGKHPK